MKRLGKWLLFALVGAAFFGGGAALSVLRAPDAVPNVSTDASTAVPPDRASGPPPGYEPPDPRDTPCLQSEYVARCIGRAKARTGLMTLAGLQEARMRERGGYAQDPASLGWTPESGMELRIRADAGGWTASYRHTATGIGCAIYAGEVEEPLVIANGGPPGTPGAVACDDPLAGEG